MKKLRKLAIITSHPIQYNAPLFQLLAKRQRVEIKVFYTWSQAIYEVEDKSFRKKIKWDIPLLNGYSYEVVPNTAKKPGSWHRRGIINPSLIPAIDNWEPDALLVFGWNFLSHFQAMKYFKGKKPVLFRGDSTLLDESIGIKTVLRRVYLKRIYRYIDYALYVGTNNKKYFLKHGLKESQLFFAPHSVDNKRFANNQNGVDYCLEAKKWREELGYSEEDIVVLFAGKFETKKNPDFLIKAINKIWEEFSYQKIKLLLVGNGVLEESLKEIAAENPNIKFLPFLNQKKMPILYRVADIFCLPSKGPGETWGLAVNEAMASGCNVLVSDKCGCAIDLVKKEQSTGRVFKHSDINDLKKNLLLMINEKKTLKSNKSVQIIKNWSYGKIIFIIEKIVNEKCGYE